jgi:hypothetical protein
MGTVIEIMVTSPAPRFCNSVYTLTRLGVTIGSGIISFCTTLSLHLVIMRMSSCSRFVTVRAAPAPGRSDPTMRNLFRCM